MENETVKQLADILEEKGVDPYDDNFKLKDWMKKQEYIGLSCPEADDCKCIIEEDGLAPCGEGCGSCYPIATQGEPHD